MVYINGYSEFITCLPTRLLCILIRAWISLGDSLESRKSLENFSPNSSSCLQPPHSQVSWGLGSGVSRSNGVKSLGRPLTLDKAWSCNWFNFKRIFSSVPLRFHSHPQPCSLPRLQAVATECMTPAASKEKAKALSRKPSGDSKIYIYIIYT